MCIRDRTKSTQIKYITGSTTGLDVGYDAGLFNGTSSSLNVYSHLVSDSVGVDFALQCLPTGNYQNMVVPIGVKATAGAQITFSSETLNLPGDITVYIEDKENGSFTRLDQTNTSYQITLQNDMNTVGRFYLHTASGVLSTDELASYNISIYSTDQRMIHIVGLENTKASLELYNLIGKQVLKESFTSQATTKEIVIPESIPSGIYIVQLITEQGKLNKKIVIN